MRERRRADRGYGEGKAPRPDIQDDQQLMAAAGTEAQSTDGAARLDSRPVADRSIKFNQFESMARTFR
jgi:hypothetical protein